MGQCLCEPTCKAPNGMANGLFVASQIPASRRSQLSTVLYIVTDVAPTICHDWYGEPVGGLSIGTKRPTRPSGCASKVGCHCGRRTGSTRSCPRLTYFRITFIRG